MTATDWWVNWWCSLMESHCFEVHHLWEQRIQSHSMMGSQFHLQGFQVNDGVRCLQDTELPSVHHSIRLPVFWQAVMKSKMTGSVCGVSHEDHIDLRENQSTILLRSGIFRSFYNSQNSSFLTISKAVRVYVLRMRWLSSINTGWVMLKDSQSLNFERFRRNSPFSENFAWT